MVPILLMLVAGALVILNIAIAAISAAQSKYLPFKTVMLYKLCLIPFYIVNFVCWMIGSMVFHLSFVVLPMLPFVIAYTYFTMIGTSVHIIVKLIDLRKNNKITTKQLIIHFILQITFTLDVLDSIYLTIKRKKFEKELGNSERVTIS